MKPLMIDELRDLAAGFVMDTLTMEERRGFESAMKDPATSAALEEEISIHRSAMQYLATSHAVTPSADLKQRVMARLADAGRERTVERPTVSMGGSESKTDVSKTQRASAMPSSLPSSTPDIGSNTGNSAGWWTAGALLVGLAATALFLVNSRTQVRSLESRLAQQVALVDSTSTTLAARERTLATLLGTGSDVTLVRLSPSATTGPDMQVFWNVRQGRAVISASGLSQVARDRTYVLWMIRDGTPVQVALFTPDAAGRAVVQDIDVPTDRARVVAFAVTEEPAGGSPQPTMTPFLVGEVPTR